MTKGDVAATHVSVVAGSYMNIRPGSGAEWSIHNIYFGTSARLFKTNGTNDIELDSKTGTGGWLYYVFSLNNTYFIRVKNDSGGSGYFGYDGKVSKA